MPTKSEVETLLLDVEGMPMSMIQKSAYNYLIDFLEEIVPNNEEGRQLVGIYVEIITELKRNQ